MPRSFRDLKVWNMSRDLAKSVYALTAEFPKHELYGLTSQMRRASVSIASNIAEGSARGTRKDFRQFLSIARGSNCELQTHFALARRLGFAASQRIDEADALSQDIGRMITGLQKYLTPPKPSKLRTDN
jgi:four helix bundle protein